MDYLVIPYPTSNNILADPAAPPPPILCQAIRKMKFFQKRNMPFSESVSPLTVIDRDGRSPSALLSEKSPWNSDSGRSEALKAGNESNAAGDGLSSSAVALGERTAFRRFLGPVYPRGAVHEDGSVIFHSNTR